jgi:hypothetical protein
MSETVVVHDEEGTGYRFSWGLAFAGAVVAAAVTLLLLTLGAGVGLLLMHPLTGDNPSIPRFLTGGAIYFFAVQAFGFAVGGHVAGRLLGPLPESHFQEEVRAAIHGLVVWALAVLGTVVMLAAAGAATAALYGINRTASEPQHTSAVIVDRLFRPGLEQTVTTPGPANPTAVPPPAIGAASPIEQPSESPSTVMLTQPAVGDGAHARAEAGRLIEADFAPGGAFTTDDRARLTELVSQQAGVSQREASLRVAAAESQLTDRMHRTAEAARKTTSYASLWIAFSLLFGALVAMVAAVTARLEDDRETAWTLFAFHRGWRS